jgi:hypothetical protein
VVVGIFIVLASVQVLVGDGVGRWSSMAMAVLWSTQTWLLQRSLLRVDTTGVLRRGNRTVHVRWEDMAHVDIR